MKKKILVTTVATSLALGSIAGLPLSNKGLQDMLGVQVAQAAALPTTATEWLDRVTKAYDTLKSEEKAIINRSATSLEEIEISDNEALVSPLVTVLNKKLEPANEVSAAETLETMKLLSHMVFTVNEPQLKERLDDYRTNSDVRAFFTKLTAQTSVKLEGNASTDISFDDFVTFANDLETALLHQVDFVDAITYIKATKSSEDVTTLKANLKSDLKSALAEVLKTPNSKIATALKYYAPDAAAEAALTQAFADSYQALTEKFDPNLNAHSQIIKGIVRSEATVTPTSSDQGRQLSLQLKILNTPVPSDLVKWSKESGATQIEPTDTGFKLNSSAEGNVKYTAKVSAYDKYFNELLYTGSIEMTYKPAPVDDDDDDDNGSPGSGGGVIPIDNGANTPPNRQETVDNANKVISDVINKIGQVTGQEKAALIENAVKEVQEALNQFSQLDLSSAVKVSDNKATVEIDTASITGQIKQIQEQAKKFNDSLKELDPKAAVKVVLTLDLGKVKADTISVPLAKEILQEAKDAGVDLVTVKVNGVAIAFDPAEFDDTTTLSIEAKSDEEATKVTHLPLASDVYEFNFTSSGQEISQFDRLVTLNIPVDSSSKMDQDLLTLGKVVEGKLEIYGGVVSDGVLSANRNSFSMYTVVENKVSFNDTASVQRWAGRQIQVVAAKGIVEGRGEQAYDPKAYVTRAEFAKMITKALGIEGTVATEAYSDVNDSDWFQPYVAAVQKWGITNGRSETTFAPNEQITRAEMATMIARAVKEVRAVESFSATDDVLAKFSDAEQVHKTLKDGVAFAADKGIIVGLPDKTFAPDQFTTRAEAAVMIYRLLNLQ